MYTNIYGLTNASHHGHEKFIMASFDSLSYKFGQVYHFFNTIQNLKH